MKTTEITLTINSEEVTAKVELNLNLKKLLVISRDFDEANEIATLQVSNDGLKLDMVRLFKIVYVAYRQANMNDYLSFSDFQDSYEFDMEEATQIYFSMINKTYRTQYLQKIQKETPKVSSKG